jgi:hypothetical protein
MSHRGRDGVARPSASPYRSRLRVIEETAQNLLDCPHEINPHLRWQLRKMVEDCDERLRKADGHVSQQRLEEE